MNNKEEEKKGRELYIFKKFALVADFFVEDEMIESPKEPAPDILCKLNGNECVAFELAEIIDEKFAERMFLLYKTNSMIRKYFETLPKDKYISFKEKYGNAFLDFRYKEWMTLRDREKSLGTAFEILLGLESDYIGEVANEQGGVLESISVERGIFIGPVFNYTSSGSFGDPTLDILRKKFNKAYTTEYPIELLLYVDFHPIRPKNTWLPQFSEFIKRTIGKSNFRKIWVFDLSANSIEYVYPS